VNITLLVIEETLLAVHISVFDRLCYPGEAFYFRISVGGITWFRSRYCKLLLIPSCVKF